jgi:hypothetical protein
MFQQAWSPLHKKMAIVFERDFARVWSDGATPYIFCSVVRVPTIAGLDDLAAKQLELIKEIKSTFGYVYSILDLRLCPPLPVAISNYYVSKVLPNQLKKGVKHKAIVEPEEKNSREVFLKAFLVVRHQPISLYTSFEKALEDMNRLSANEKPLLRKLKPTAFIQVIYERLF